MDCIVHPLDLKRVFLRSLSHEVEEGHAQLSCPTDEENDRECHCLIWARGLVKESQLCLSVVDDLVFTVKFQEKSLKGKEVCFVHVFLRKIFVCYYKTVEINWRPEAQWQLLIEICFSTSFPNCLCLLLSHSVLADSLWPLGLQHSRIPCPSPSPRAWSNSHLLSLWCPMSQGSGAWTTSAW